MKYAPSVNASTLNLYQDRWCEGGHYAPTGHFRISSTGKVHLRCEECENTGRREKANQWWGK